MWSCGRTMPREKREGELVRDDGTGISDQVRGG